MRDFLLSAAVWFFLGFGLAASTGRAAGSEEGWVPLFDGHSLDGWKAAEHPATFRVEDGAIIARGPRAHLFYVGEKGAAEFEAFEFSAEVLAKPGANSGVFFHTAWQESGWPEQGFEVQVNNSQRQHGDYLEMKKTGSLYAVRNVYRAVAPDNAWFTLKVRVQKPRVQIWVNDALTVDYVEPANTWSDDGPSLNRLGRGTFALQGHDPASEVHYRALRVRRLPAGGEPGARAVSWDAQTIRLLALGQENFPLVDLHTHLKGDLTLERALELSRATGMGLGIAVNGGRDFPVQDDAAARDFIASLRGQPVFVGLQAEGREWTQLFSKQARAAFDYIFSDAMTFTNRAGKRLRLWIPAEADVGPDAEAFMDELVAMIVRIVATEPIDVYANPTYLPASLAARAEGLWSEARMQAVIDACVKHGVAIEINARFKLPSETFLRRAKKTGVKFTIGTNNTSARNFGDWSYPLEMQQKLGLTWKDMWVPGHAPSRAKRELAR